MKNKSLKRIAFTSVFSLLLLSTAYVEAITDLATSPAASTTNSATSLEQKTKFISNTLLVKVKAQARANLKVSGQEVNPAATGLQSLDLICRDYGVQRFSSIISAGVHRDSVAAINSWYKLRDRKSTRLNSSHLGIS